MGRRMFGVVRNSVYSRFGDNISGLVGHSWLPPGADSTTGKFRADAADVSPKQLSAVAAMPVVDGTHRIVACASERKGQAR